MSEVAILQTDARAHLTLGGNERKNISVKYSKTLIRTNIYFLIQQHCYNSLFLQYEDDDLVSIY